MDSFRRAGRLLVAGLPGPELKPDTEAALADLAPAGVILFARNLKSPAQVRDLILGVRESVPHPVFVAVDQEGGRVNRLAAISEEFARLPDGRIQAGWSEERIDDIWAAAGRALAALGFDVDFAPVVDLDDGPGTNAIGPRSFGLDPERVAAVAARVLGGLARGGVAGCLKHFPGLGGTDLDTHQALATSPVGRDALRDLHASPYRALAASAPMVMTAHAHYPAIDGPDPLPATFSRRLLRGWLREEFGYDGLVVSDDLEMGAVAADGSPGARARRALDAGCDLALFCHELDVPRRARDEVAAALDAGDLDGQRALDSLRRQARLLGSFPGGRAAGTSSVDRFAAAASELASLVSRA